MQIAPQPKTAVAQILLGALRGTKTGLKGAAFKQYGRPDPSQSGIAG
jgi:hypothetical protein